MSEMMSTMNRTRSAHRVPRCAQCGEPLKTLPGKIALPNLPILCKQCFGIGTYERKGRSWLDLLYAPAIAEGGEIELEV
jgi:hypothetical protein